MNTSKRRLALAGAICLSLVAAACGSDEEDAATTTAAAEESTTVAPETSEETPESSEGGATELVGGEVFVSGSSTVEPISVLVSELAGDLTGQELAVTVEGPGTGDGFAKFCAGEADISDASRPIREEEAAICADAGIEFVELEVAIDGLTVATNVNNTAVECLDPAALYALLGPESEGFSNWADANDLATELGSASVPLPDAPLDITGPGVESGTYDTLVEFVAGPFAEDRGQEDKFRSDYTQSANDNLIIEGIEATDTSLGWVGFAFYEIEAAEGRIGGIAIDDGAGCVEPTYDTISDGSYPFSRSLYIYVNLNAAAENPAVGSFVDVYLSPEGLALVQQAGYVSLPDERIAATIDAWAAAG